MRCLNFTLHDFTRLSWVSDQARTIWEPRMNRITQVWKEVEWLAVALGVYPCHMVTVSLEDFVDRAGKWAKRGLNALPLGIEELSGAPNPGSTVNLNQGKRFLFRVILGVPLDVSAFKQAWDADDNATIGRLLGYPRCCLDFFRKVYGEQGLIDGTWSMAEATTVPLKDVHSIEITAPPEVNTLWHFMGIKTISHSPCRFDCKESTLLGKKLVEVGRENGYTREMDWLLEVLSWPVEWSALHGIAEIKTPLLKVSTRTDATAHKYTVQIQGNAYPLEGAEGLNFPYRMLGQPRVTTSRQFQQGLDNPIWTLNKDAQ